MRSPLRLLPLLLLLGTLGFVPRLHGPGRGRVIVVPVNESSIMNAMINAVRGDTIKVAPGVYKENIMLRSGVWLQSAVGPERTTLVGTQGRPVVSVPVGGRGTGLEGFTLEGGSVGVQVDGSSADVQECRVPLPMTTAFACGSRGELYLRSCTVERCETGVEVEAGGRLTVLNCELTGNQTGIQINGAQTRVHHSRLVGNEVALKIGPRGRADVGGTRKFGNDFWGNTLAVWSLADTLLSFPFNSWGTMACDSIQTQIRGEIEFLPAVSLDRSQTVESCK